MKKSLVLILVVFVLMGCSKEEESGNALLGKWALQSVENEALYTSPEDEQILITFESTTYAGITENNDFGGDYSIDVDSLYLTNSYTTEIEETAWGNVFYETLRKAYNEDKERSEFKYILQANELTLRNSEEILIFRRSE